MGGKTGGGGGIIWQLRGLVAKGPWLAVSESIYPLAKLLDLENTHLLGGSFLARSGQLLC